MTDWPVWRFLLRLIAFRRVLWSTNALSITLLSVLENVPGLVARSFFDWLGARPSAWQPLWWLLALLSVACIGRVAFLVGCQLTNAPFFLSAAALLQKNMLTHTLELPGAAGLPHSSGEAISRFRDDVDDTTILPIGINDMIAWLVFGLVALATMLVINPLITLVLFVPLLVLVTVVNSARTRIETYRRASRASTGAVTAFLAEVFAAATTIKVAAAEARTVQQFRELNHVRLEATIRDRVFDQILQSISRNVSNLGTGVILLMVAGSISAGAFNVGDFALFVFYLGWVGEFTNQFGIVLALYRRAGVSFVRMSELLGGAPQQRLVQHGPVHPPLAEGPARRLDHETLHVMRAEGLSYRYSGSGRGIRDVSLSLKRGQLVVVTGRVASGKTTLLRVLLGLLPRHAGAIYWNDRQVDDPATFFVAPHCAYTPQVPRMFSDTLRDNVQLGFGAAEADLYSAVATAQLAPDLAELVDGLETQIGPRGVALSGGQVQRAAVARMLVRRPELLVIDDLSALDVHTETQLWEQLRTDGSHTIVAVSHRRTVLRAADHIIVLRDGAVAATGRFEDVQAYL